MFAYEYLVGGVIAVCGTAFAFFNAYMTAADDRTREAEEHASRVAAEAARAETVRAREAA